jgi:hypothetical protein
MQAIRSLLHWVISATESDLLSAARKVSICEAGSMNSFYAEHTDAQSRRDVRVELRANPHNGPLSRSTTHPSVAGEMKLLSLRS